MQSRSWSNQTQNYDRSSKSCELCKNGAFSHLTWDLIPRNEFWGLRFQGLAVVFSYKGGKLPLGENRRRIPAVFTDVLLPRAGLFMVLFVTGKEQTDSARLHRACVQPSGRAALRLNQWPIQFHAPCWHLTNRGRKVNGIPYVCTVQWLIVSQCYLAEKPN